MNDEDCGNKYKEFGESVRKIRKEKGITQTELSIMADMAFPTVSNVERGQGNPKFDTLERIAEALNASIVLVPEENDETANNNEREINRMMKKLKELSPQAQTTVLDTLKPLISGMEAFKQ